MLVNDIDQRESKIQNIINKIKFNFSKSQEDYEEWTEEIGIPDYIPESLSKEILEHAYEDMKLADNLIDDKSVDWSKINQNYHMNIGYSAHYLLDTIIFIKIYESVKTKFEYEGNNYLNGMESVYDPLDYKGQDRKIFEKFHNIISGLRVIGYRNGDFHCIKGHCIKHFQSLCDYHARDVLEKIDRIIEVCKKNLLDAPILWIANEIRDYLDIIKENSYLKKFEFKDWTTIRWERCSLVFEDNELYDSDMMEEEKRIENEVISKLMELFEGLTMDKVIDRYELYFTYDEWEKYMNLCRLKSEAETSYVLSGDMLDLFQNATFAGDFVLLELNRFDVCNVLPEVLLSG